MKKRSGFTMIEMLVVVAIIFAITIIAIPYLTGRTDSAKRASARATMKELINAEQQCEADTGYFVRLSVLDDNQGFRSSVDEPLAIRDEVSTNLLIDPNTGLALSGNATFYRDWNGPYVNFASGVIAEQTLTNSIGPRDPWGNEYLFFTQASAVEFDGVISESSFDPYDRMTLATFGKDGRPGRGAIADSNGDGFWDARNDGYGTINLGELGFVDPVDGIYGNGDDIESDDIVMHF
jgi:prepilin-type N-terminal cleavage/methylation domain-containing protein